uniref:SJCHGC02989 protein n=1 Tax=Schistosoma japonicum TaxID=6182 RepID=Q5DAT6_SCHJA|nr:SJCHGC02989 protein [Schistosoma japonicum]
MDSTELEALFEQQLKLMQLFTDWKTVFNSTSSAPTFGAVHSADTIANSIVEFMIPTQTLLLTPGSVDMKIFLTLISLLRRCLKVRLLLQKVNQAELDTSYYLKSKGQDINETECR